MRNIILIILIILTLFESVSAENYTSDFWFNRGNSFLHEGDLRISHSSSINPSTFINPSTLIEYQLADRCFDKALELDSKNATIWYIKGETLRSSLKFTEAIIAYDNSINLNPLNASAWFFRGLCLDNLSRSQEALMSYMKAKELDSKYNNSYYKNAFKKFNTNIGWILKLLRFCIIILIIVGLVFIIKKEESNNSKIKISSKSSTEEIQLLDSERVENAIINFKRIKNPSLQIISIVLPFIALLDSIYQLIIEFSAPGFFMDYMSASALVAVAVALFAFRHLMNMIPKALGSIWDKNILLNMTNPLLLEDQYISFIKNFAIQLNSSKQWISGLICSVLGFFIGLFNLRFSGYEFFFGLFNLRFSGDGIKSWIISDPYNFFQIIVLYPFIGFVLGLLIWRMYVISREVIQLGRKFKLNPQPEDSDGCGGLEPIGNLCLWNALIISIMAIWLAGWIILVTMPPFEIYGPQYRSIHSVLLIIPISLSIIAFFYPLWKIHNQMETGPTKTYQGSNQLNNKINRLDQEMLGQPVTPNLGEKGKVVEKQDLIQQDYKITSNYPTWPFNTSILKKLALSQTVPFLSLLGLGKPIIDFISNLLNLISTG